MNTTSCHAARTLSGVCGSLVINAIRSIRFFTFALFVLVATGARASDWAVSLSNEGFEPSPAGTVVEYLVRVSNASDAGSNSATTVTISIPENSEYQGVSGPAGIDCSGVANPTLGAADITCNVDQLINPQDKAETKVLIKALTTGQQEITATLPSDDNTTNDVATLSTKIESGSDLSVSMTGPNILASGSAATYSASVINLGPDATNTAQLSFAIPDGLTNVRVPAGCSKVGSTINCTIPGPFGIGDIATFDFTGQISGTNGVIVNPIVAVTTTDPLDGVATNNDATVLTEITEGTDVSLAKSHSPSGAEIIQGTAVDFTITPTFTGETPGALTVTDVIPSMYTITTVSATGWDCTTTGQTVECTQTPTQESGANVALGPIVVSTVADNLGTEINQATITQAGGPTDVNESNNTATDIEVTVVEPYIDLVPTITGPITGLLSVGNPYEFTIGTSNIGNVPYYGTAQIDFTVPAGVTLDNLQPAGWSCLPEAPITGEATMVCTQTISETTPLDVHGSTDVVTFNLTTSVAGPIEPEMVVSAGPDSNLPEKIDPANGIDDTANNSLIYPVVGQISTESGDLSITKSATLASLESGQIQTFTITVSNAGPYASKDVTMTDVLSNLINANVGPTDAGFIDATVVEAASGSNTTCSTARSGDTGRALTCVTDSLPANESVTITVNIRPGGNAGSRTNTAEVYSYVTADQVLSNNVASAGFSIAAKTDVTVQKVASAATAPAGQYLTYVITASVPATGQSRADNVVITDTLPLGVEFISATPASGSCTQVPVANALIDATNQEMICNLGTIANGSSKSTVVVVRPVNAQVTNVITNSVVVATDTDETDATNNEASVDVTVVNPSLDLQVTKNTDEDVLVRELRIDYRLAVRNNGNSVANNVIMNDVMPDAGITFKSVTIPEGATCSNIPAVDSTGQTLTCEIPKLEKGETATFIVSAEGVKKGVWTNTASVSSDETRDYSGDTYIQNNTATKNITVVTKVDLWVEKPDHEDIYLRDYFDWVVTVHNSTGGLNLQQEADNVKFVDTLPAGMVAAANPTVQLSGLGTIPESETIGLTARTDLCTYPQNTKDVITCENLATLPYGETFTITIPLRQTTLYGGNNPPLTLTNSATVTTTSAEYDNTNNTNTGNVDVYGSLVDFNIYFDFNNNGVRDPNDIGIKDYLIEIGGVDTSVGSAVAFRQYTSGTGGVNSMRYLPAGTYEIRQVTASPIYSIDGKTNATELVSGQTLTGTVSGDLLSFTDVIVGSGVHLKEYQFPKVPIARVGIAKSVLSAPTINATDGSFRTTFRMTVENFSLEPLIDVAVNDQLAGAAPLFGDFASLANPTTDPMAAGTYTVVGTSGTCGGANATFDGKDDTVVASGIEIAARTTCYIDLELRVQPTLPLPQLQPSGDMYINQATVTGKGKFSGQTPESQLIDFGTNYLTDSSHLGTDSDPNNSLHAQDENTPTPVTPVYAPAITLEKTIDFTSLPNVPVQEGDFVTYKFTVKNTGNLPLTNITLTDADPLVVLSGPNGTLTLQPGESSTAFSGQYPVQADDLANNNFDNTATVTGLYGKDKDGNDLTTSATDTVTEPLAAIAIIKSSDITAIQSPAQVGDEITFTFTVKNTGNVDLVNVVVDDPLTGLDMPVTEIASLPVGQEATLTATYPITQADIDARKVDNQAKATGKFGAGGQTVEDLSGATYEEDAPLRTPLVPVAKVELIKKLVGYTDVNTSGMADEGDTLSYAFEIKNIGNVKLGDITISDPDATVVEDTAVTPFTLVVGASNTDRFTATYTLTQADIDRGYFENKATVSVKGVADDGTTPVNDDQGAQLTATDASDTGTTPAVAETTTDFAAALITDPASVDTPNGAGAQDGDLGNDPTVAVFTREPSIVLVKTLVDVEDTNTTTREDAGDTAKYAFTVTNTGNVYLVIDTITDTIADNVSGGPITLAPGAVSNGDFTATYVIGQDDIDAGYIENTATVVGKAVDQSGNPINDDTGTQIEVSDTSDTDTDATGAAITDAATNETEAADGSTDGDATNDPTVYRFANRAQVSLFKSVASINDTDGDGILEKDETVTYAFTVKNIGSVALAGVTITDDNAELFHNGTALTTQTIDLAIDGVDSTTFTAVHTVTQADIDAGIFENSATVSGNAVTATGVQIVENGADLTTSDVSDAGTDQLMVTPDVMDGTTPITEIVDPEATETLDKANDAGADSASDPTVVILEQRPLIRLIKSFDRVEDVDRNNRDDKDDIIHYTFTVENIGNMKLADITITDPKATSVKGGPITLDPLGVDSTSFTATYVIKQEDLDRGYFENTAQVTGTAVDENGDVIKDASDQPLVATDDSDTGTNPDKSAEIDPEGTETPDGQNGGDGDPSNDPTVVNLIPAPAISLVKIADTSGYSVPVAIGDWIEYTFEVTNTGNRTLYNVTVTDPLPGLQLTGAPIPVLNPGDTDNSTYTARYQLTLADFQTAKVINQATVTGEYDQTDPANPLTVTDLSGTEGDNDTPTETIVGEPEIDLVIGIAEIQDINGNANPDAGDVIVYTFTVINTGTLGLVDVNMDLASLSLPLPNLSCAPVTLVPDEAVQLVCTGAEYTITQADVDRGSVTLSGEDQGTAPTSEVVKAYDEITTTLGNGGLTIQKTTVADIVYPGDLVPYTLTITSKPDSLAVDVDVVDYMPKGFVYQNNTSKLDGTPIAATVSGRTLTFENVHLEPGQTVNITLNLFVSASVTPDEYINTTYPLSALSGVQLAPNATATVRVAVDAAMMCSSIIGRVFDDHDQDGVMDEGVDKGIPAVKLLTTRGLAIKTDEHGRFSVPCAALPSAEGGNFMLKIDERSLPSGYRMTTENPRVVRVTPGMLTKMNFGAALSRLIRIDLNASAFEIRDDRLYMTKPLSDGIQALVDQMKNQPAFVRLTYQIGDERRSEAKRNINAVTHALREAWRKQGQYQLNIETEIVSSTQRGAQN